jgi:hypothetical protein
VCRSVRRAAGGMAGRQRDAGLVASSIAARELGHRHGCSRPGLWCWRPRVGAGPRFSSTVRVAVKADPSLECEVDRIGRPAPFGWRLTPQPSIWGARGPWSPLGHGPIRGGLCRSGARGQAGEPSRPVRSPGNPGRGPMKQSPSPPATAP